MTPNEYQILASRTISGACDLPNAGLGLAGESGEVADMIKKHVYQGHPLHREDIMEELGDVLWYVALTCSLCRIPLESVMEVNISKLRKRYPKGFTVTDSIARRDKIDPTGR